MEPNFFLARRQELGLTQRAIALRLDMTTTAVGRWENGLDLPKVQNYTKLARAYEVPLEQIAIEIAKLAARPKPAAAGA